MSGIGPVRSLSCRSRTVRCSWLKREAGTVPRNSLSDRSSWCSFFQPAKVESDRGSAKKLSSRYTYLMVSVFLMWSRLPSIWLSSRARNSRLDSFLKLDGILPSIMLLERTMTLRSGMEWKASGSVPVMLRLYSRAKTRRLVNCSSSWGMVPAMSLLGSQIWLTVPSSVPPSQCAPQKYTSSPSVWISYHSHSSLPERKEKG
mmetsp:Transcript_26109/g.60962  ORF Transcript_26109/g.60962 Transcript_26109/m.60962 type:complete len:202 (-) Transcript_26109:682-1287(-)